MNKTAIRKRVFGFSTKALLLCFFAVAVVLPLVQVFIHVGGADIKEIFFSERGGAAARNAILNSLKVSLTSTALSVILAGAAAWCINRTNVKLKALFNVLLILPMLIPSISHGTGLVILFGSNGILTRFFGLSKGIYGFWGIVIGSMMYAFPIAFLMLADILKYEDATPYEAASVLGIPKARRFTSITFPYLKKPLISVVFAVFTAVITDYGVPLAVGGTYKTLPVLMYEETVGRLDIEKGSAFGAVLLLPAVAAFLVDTFCKNRTDKNFTAKAFAPKKSIVRDALSYLFLALLSVCVITPILSFLPVALSANYPIDTTFTLKNLQLVFVVKNGLRYLLNSLLIAVLVSALGAVISFFCAYFTARRGGAVSRLLHFFSIISLAIPGIVLGLSYMLAFNGSFIYGTFAIIIMANTVHFFSSPYLMVYNSLGKLNPNLEAVGAALGIGNVHIIKDVIIPQVKGTLLEVFSYFFVNSMMTISAVAFLANRVTKPISLMLTEFDASQTLLAPAALVSLLILIVNLILKGIIYMIKKIGNKKKRRA